jgi:hypothetical protein
MKDHVVIGYGLGGSGFESQQGQRNRLDRTCGPKCFPFGGYRVSFPEVKRSERDVDQVEV